MSVPFPFGLDESRAWNADLVLFCDRTLGNLSLGENIPLFDISMEWGTMNIGLYRALDCYDKSGDWLDGSNPNLSITAGKGRPYTFSDTQNNLSLRLRHHGSYLGRCWDFREEVLLLLLQRRQLHSLECLLRPWLLSDVDFQEPQDPLYPWAAPRITPWLRTSALADQRS
ncbi:hypothetical protein NL676_025425 [Syzygium grande]|nr:hypothetical protein NL676_025425 [Syzygium grande]